MRSPTPRQKKAAKAVVENLASDKPLPTGQVLENVSYGKISGQPSRILESAGFKQALRDMGLTEELITNALVDDIAAKPKQRIQELKLGAEILGMVKRDEEPLKNPTGNTYNFLFSDKVQVEVAQINDKIKEFLTKNV